jgi:hypothetical protein
MRHLQTDFARQRNAPTLTRRTSRDLSARTHERLLDGWRWRRSRARMCVGDSSRCLPYSSTCPACCSHKPRTTGCSHRILHLITKSRSSSWVEATGARSWGSSTRSPRASSSSQWILLTSSTSSMTFLVPIGRALLGGTSRQAGPPFPAKALGSWVVVGIPATASPFSTSGRRRRRSSPSFIGWRRSSWLPSTASCRGRSIPTTLTCRTSWICASPKIEQRLASTPPGLTGDDLATCQALGKAAFACGREGIIAPSATGVDSVVAIFPERLVPGSTVRDVDAEMWETVPQLRRS